MEHFYKMIESITDAEILKHNELLDVFSYKGYTCFIRILCNEIDNEHSLTYLTGYVLLQDSNAKHQAYNNAPYCTYAGLAEFEDLRGSDLHHKFCIGLDMAHSWNFEEHTNLDLQMTKKQVYELVDWCIENNFK